MDLLDPNKEPMTYKQNFVISICTIRDLICWFHQCRSDNRRAINSFETNHQSRLTISCDTSVHTLIEMFQNLKWHLVVIPEEFVATTIRLFGLEHLDKTLEHLKLNSAKNHLLAVVSCIIDFKSQISSSASTRLYSTANANHDVAPQSMSLVSLDGIHNNRNQSCRNYQKTFHDHQNYSQPLSMLDECNLTIRHINYHDNPLYLNGNNIFNGNYNPNQITLKQVAVEFSSFSGIDLRTFILFQMHPRKIFSFPTDYLQKLSDLGLCGNVTLYCHLKNSNNWYLNCNIGDGDTTSSGDSSGDSGSFSSSHTKVSENENMKNVYSCSLQNWNQVDNSDSDDNIHNRNNNGGPSFFSQYQLFGGVSEIPFNNEYSSSSQSPSLLKVDLKKPDSLFCLCFNQVFYCITTFNEEICSGVKKLPNNIQQNLIKRFVDQQTLTMTFLPFLSFFCHPDGCLTSLDLSYCKIVTNDILKCIGSCRLLEELVLDNDDDEDGNDLAFTNDGMWYLQHCGNLKRLSVNYCSKIDDWGLQVVGCLPVLSVLGIKCTSVTNSGLKQLYWHYKSNAETIGLPGLRSIDLSGLSVSDEGFSYLSVFNRLELLNLASTQITDPSLFPLLVNLRHLDISNCDRLVWEDQIHIRSLSDSFPNLTSINLRGVSDCNLAHLIVAISQCKHIKQLDGIFCHSEMTAGLAASLSHLPLETIILTNCRHITDLWLPILARFSSTLTHLVLSSCPGVRGDNESLVKNFGRLKNLSWLDLTNLENVSSDQIFQLSLNNFFPRLQVLWISLTDQDEIKFRSLAKDLHFNVNITKSLINPSGI